MGPMNLIPTVATVGASENAEQKVLIATCFVLRKRVEHIRFRRTDCQGRATKKRGTGKSVSQLLPFLSCGPGTPNTALHPLFCERREYRSFRFWMEDN